MDLVLETWANIASLMAGCEVRQLYEWAKVPLEVPIAGMRVLGEARTRRLVVQVGCVKAVRRTGRSSLQWVYLRAVFGLPAAFLFWL
jgi:hypothetical protein